MFPYFKNKFRCVCCFFTSPGIITKRNVKRKYPIDRDHEFGLPVFQYPVGSSRDRRVYVWGLSEHGALGNKLQIIKYRKRLPEYHYKPLRLTFAELNEVTDIACGYGFTLFAVNTKEKYKVFGCGINSDSQVGCHEPRRGHPLGLVVSPAPIELPLLSDTRVLGLAAGRAHTLVLTSQGVYSLGNNAYGQCGRRVIPEERYSGSRVAHHIPSLDGVPISVVHCGQDHSLFLTANGHVYSCGWGADGQLGLGEFVSQWRPTKVAGDILGERITKVAGTGDCVLALNENGEVFGWGNNEYKQITDAGDMQQISSPTHVACTQGLGRIVDIAVGGSFCAVLNEAGAVFVWGFGLLGLGPNVQISAKPLEVPRILFGENVFLPNSRVTALGSGLYHLAAVTSLGQLYMWGRNKGGCLGLGHLNDQFFPLKVNIGAHVIKVVSGVDHTVTLCKPFT